MADTNPIPISIPPPNLTARGVSPPAPRRSRQVAGVALALALALVVALAPAAPAAAVRLEQLTLEQLRARAGTVLIGTVLAQTARTDPATTMVWTDYALRVEEVLAGNGAAGGTLTVSFAGGDHRHRRITFVDAPTLEAGGRYLLFLKADRPYVVPTVGWGQGIFRLTGGDATPLSSADGSPLWRTADGLLRRGRPAAGPAAAPDRAADPQVFAGDGRPLSLTAAPAAKRAAVGVPATLADLRAFLHRPAP